MNGMARAQALLEQLALGAGLPAQAASRVRIIGADPVVRTVLRVGEAGAAAIAASGMAAAWLWFQKRGELQQVTVEVAAAVAAMQSYKFLEIDGKPPGPVMDELTGFYPVKDARWIYLHCNFPNLAARNVQALGAEPTSSSVRAAAAGWNGADLEETILGAGGCAAFVRTEEEWRASPQGMAALAEPLLEITKIADSPPMPLAQGERPLSGVRVLDLTRVLAGPTCAKNLAEHGADVLRISRLGLPDSGVLDLDTSLGKLSAWLDLRDVAQMQVMRELVKGCDVFSQAYRPGSLARRGLSPEELAQLRPGIVCVTLNAWGHRGPWSERRGYDTVVQAANGMAWTGAAEPPALLPVAVQDYVAGYLMAYGAMVALSRRASEGGSWLVRVSLAACGEWLRRQGRLTPLDCAHCPVQVPRTVVQPWLAQSSSAAGLLTHLGSVTQMALTPTRWDRGAMVTGASAPAWP